MKKFEEWSAPPTACVVHLDNGRYVIIEKLVSQHNAY